MEGGIFVRLYRFVECFYIFIKDRRHVEDCSADLMKRLWEDRDLRYFEGFRVRKGWRNLFVCFIVQAQGIILSAVRTILDT